MLQARILSSENSLIRLHRCPHGSCGHLSRWQGGIPARGPARVVASLPFPALPQFPFSLWQEPLLRWF